MPIIRKRREADSLVDPVERYARKIGALYGMGSLGVTAGVYGAINDNPWLTFGGSAFVGLASYWVHKIKGRMNRKGRNVLDTRLEKEAEDYQRDARGVAKAGMAIAEVIYELDQNQRAFAKVLVEALDKNGNGKKIPNYEPVVELDIDDKDLGRILALTDSGNEKGNGKP